MNRHPLEMERIRRAIASFLREDRCDIFVLMISTPASEVRFAATHPPGKCIVVVLLLCQREALLIVPSP